MGIQSNHRQKLMTTDTGHYLSIYIHAHKTGNNVPPHIEAEAIAALKAKPEPIERPVWTEGVCGDGAAILKDGVMQPIENVIAALNAAEVVQPESDTSQLSDGYHTFAELYEHRYALCLALMRSMPQHWWFSRRHADGELCFGGNDWFIVGAELPGLDDASVTYHLPMRLWDAAQATGAQELPKGRPWDGHSAQDVVDRFMLWAALPRSGSAGLPPRVGHVLRLAEIIREVDGNHDKGAAALAEAILDHPDSRWEPREAQPVPVGPSDEELWYPGFADWLEREMPEGTVIGDPLWWASKIADYIARYGRPAITPIPVSERP